MDQRSQATRCRPVVLITGCSNSGIGSHLAKHFALNNCITYATARDPKKFSKEKSHVYNQLEMDVCSPESIQKAVDYIYNNEGRIDILINNAGVNFNGPVVELDITKAANVLDTNVLGALRVIQAVAPFMIRNGGGTIINVGSIVGDFSTPWAGIYSASKAALHSLTDALRLELRPFNIDVAIVKPGAVTSSIAKNNLALRNFGESHTDATSVSILVSDSFYKKVEGYIFKRINFSQDVNAYDTDLFAQKVVYWILNRRNLTMVKLNYWLNPVNVTLGFLAWGISRVSPSLAPSMSYFNGYNWTLPNELVLGGSTWAHSLSKYLPGFVLDAILWSKFGLGTLAVANNDSSTFKKD